MAPQVSSLRPQVSQEDIDAGVKKIVDKLNYRLETKGRGAYASKHEAWGIIAEEIDEALEELRDNTSEGLAAFSRELRDIGVACLFASICIDSGYIKSKK